MRLRVLVPLLVLGPLASCASVMHGTRQDVSIASTPVAARVVVDNVPHGVTPLVARLPRKRGHTLRIELEGYQPYEFTLSRKTSGWYWGNLLLGGVPGLAVDAVNGGMYKLTPDQVHSRLGGARTGSRATPRRVGVYVALVARADPSWPKVGALRPATGRP